MIEFIDGNLFDSACEALVNPVNCMGVMGKGLALQFKKLYPDMFSQYWRDCAAGKYKIGQVILWEDKEYTEGFPKFIINFPTKQHWKNPSKLDWIQSGLYSLNLEICKHNIQSIAIPALGCDNGGLSWGKVKPLLEEFACTLLAEWDVLVEIYEPLI